MADSVPWKHHSALIITSILYGFIGIFIKYIGTAIPLMTISFLRFFFALLLLVLVVPLIDRNTFHLAARDFWHYAFMGFLVAAAISTYNAALFYSTVSAVTLIWSVYVFFTAVLAYFVLNEHLTLRCFIAILIGIAGLVLINPLTGGGNLLGNVIALISAGFYATYLVFIRRDERSHTLGMVFWIILFATLYLLPFPFIFGLGQLSGAPLLWMLLLGVGCTGIAYFLLNVGLARVEADSASVLILVVSTIASLFLAWLLLDEHIGTRMLIGGAMMIIAGVIMELKYPRI